MRKSDLVTVQASTFYKGMYIEGEVYFKYENSYIMLCKDVTVSPELLAKFYQSEWGNQELYVHKNYLSGILALSQKFKLQNGEGVEPAPVFEMPEDGGAALRDVAELAVKINLRDDYNNIKSRLNSIMDSVQTEGVIAMDAPDKLTDDIREKIELTDPVLLIDCINNLRDPDDYLNAHAANVAMLNGLMGSWLGLPQEENEALIKTGLLHDVGKLRVPIEILNKPGALTEAEFEIMKKHPVYSYEVLKLSGETDNRIMEGALSHHEKLNGSGYPNGLQVTQISLFARITAVSDVYDAMVAKRVYKTSHSPFVILEEFAYHKYSNLDIGIVNVFLDKLPAVLTGKNVLLSDGRTAKVVYVNPNSFAYPIVEIDGKMILTSPELECISLDNFLASVED